MDDATVKFQASLPYALLPVSPSFAALHFVRVKSSNSCHQCGCALHRGESSVRTVRSKAPRSRAIQTTCLICGWVQKEPLIGGNASLFSRTKKQSAATSPAVVREPKNNLAMPKVEEAPKHPIAPRNAPSSQQATPAPPLPKSRNNKGGLQSMLDRNKKRESKEKQKGKGDAVGGGLAMFLNNL